MSDLISRELLTKEIINRPTEQSGYNPVYLNGCATRQNEIINIINDIPTVEAVPVVHAEWIHVPSSDMATGQAYECSNCKKMRYGSFLPPFCQMCGADIKKKERK